MTVNFQLTKLEPTACKSVVVQFLLSRLKGICLYHKASSSKMTIRNLERNQWRKRFHNIPIWFENLGMIEKAKKQDNRNLPFQIQLIQ